MAAGINDLFKKTYNSANPNVARVTATRTAGGTSLTCDNLAGWATTTSVDFSTYKLNTSNAVVAGSQIDWKGIVSGNTVGTLTRITGATDAGSAIGDVVEMNPTANWANDLVTGILNFTDQDATLKAGAVDNAAVIASGIITDTQMSTEVKPVTRATETFFDFVASGLVWSGDAYASTRNASMTAGVIYINGQRMTLSAVTARSFTASKDTYIDVLNTAGVASLVYTEVANNAASPALSANSVRIGIIITGASNIAAATSVNQGQETMVLPIASSIPYAVTDSLGNLICPRDPNRKTLGYRQIIANFTTTSASAVQVTGLTVPVVVPLGRKIKITIYATGLYISSVSASAIAAIWDGVVASGTQLNRMLGPGANGGSASSGTCFAITTPTTASKTYNMGAVSTGGFTVTVEGSSTSVSFIKVELA